MKEKYVEIVNIIVTKMMIGFARIPKAIAIRVGQNTKIVVWTLRRESNEED